MTRMRLYLSALVSLLVTACAAGPADDGASTTVALACTPQQDPTDRISPYDSVSLSSGPLQAKLCYGRPSSRGRTMLGSELVPYGQLWRTGANEPTTLHLATAAEIAGIRVEPGSYSIYTVPDEDAWEVIVNRSTSQWGHESTYTEEVAAQEVGRARVVREDLAEHLETFTISAVELDAGVADLVLEWETTRVVIPVQVVED